MGSPMRKLVIVGAGGTARAVFCELIDSDTQVVGFAVEREYISAAEHFGVPVVAFEQVESIFPPGEHDALVVTSFSRLNRNRERLFNATRNKGYKCISHISPRACLGPRVKLGENVVILENSTIQYDCQIGDDTMIWSGVVILHETTIGSHVCINANTIVAGCCRIGDYCVLGINSAVADYLEIGRDCTIAAGSVVTRNLPDDTFIRPQKMFVKDGSRKFWEDR